MLKASLTILRMYFFFVFAMAVVCGNFFLLGTDTKAPIFALVGFAGTSFVVVVGALLELATCEESDGNALN